MRTIKIVILAEGDTEKIIMPIFFRRCVQHITHSNEIKVEMVDFIEKRDKVGFAKVKALLQPTYYQYAGNPNFNTDLLLIGVDNDNKENNPPHTPEHHQSPLASCRFCYLEQEVARFRQSWMAKKLHTIFFVPVEVIESWLLLGARIVGRTPEPFPEKLSKDQAKTKLCGYSRLTRRIIEAVHKPIAEKIDLTNLRQNVKSFDLFYTQIQEWLDTSQIEDA